MPLCYPAGDGELGYIYIYIYEVLGEKFKGVIAAQRNK
jgi:hypothetical protein